MHQLQSRLLGTASASDAVGISEITNDAPEIFPFGTTIVTWTATDISGNSNSAVQSVTIHDTVPPSITAPQNITVEAQNPTSNQIDLGVAKTDDAIGVVEVKHNSPLHFPLGTTLVTWTATDASGNSASDVQTIIVRDTTDPVLVTPLDVIAEAVSADGTPVSIGNATATDIDFVTITNDAPELYVIGTTHVTWTATDASGNTAVQVQSVTIQDTTSSVIAPDDIVSRQL